MVLTARSNTSTYRTPMHSGMKFVITTTIPSRPTLCMLSRLRMPTNISFTFWGLRATPPSAMTCTSRTKPVIASGAEPPSFPLRQRGLVGRAISPVACPSLFT